MNNHVLSLWAEENGHVTVAPVDAKNYYLRKIADAFVGAIEERAHLMEEIEIIKRKKVLDHIKKKASKKSPGKEE